MPQHVLRAATGLFILSLLAACSRPEPAAEPVRAVRTLVVGAQGAAPGAQYAAEIRARTETALSFRVAGRLDARAVDNGQRVAAGQLLARLDPTDYRLGQQAAEAGLSAARTSLEQAEADLQRSRDLRAQGFVGPAELERRENAAKAARAQWEQARASSEGQGRQTEYTRLTAPAAGVVTAVLAEPGQVLSAGTPVLRLAHDGPLDAVFQVPEDQVSKVRALVGKAGALSVVAWGDSREWPARVREVAGAADPVTRTFAVRADLGPATLALGQTAVVRWTAAEGAAALRLPLSAVVAQGAGSAVWLLDRAKGSVHLQAVQVGTAQGNELLITGGLKAGDEVVTAGTHVLTPGQKVKPWQAPAASAAAQ